MHSDRFSSVSFVSNYVLSKIKEKFKGFKVPGLRFKKMGVQSVGASVQRFKDFNFLNRKSSFLNSQLVNLTWKVSENQEVTISTVKRHVRSPVPQQSTSLTIKFFFV